MSGLLFVDSVRLLNLSPSGVSVVLAVVGASPVQFDAVGELSKYDIRSGWKIV